MADEEFREILRQELAPLKERLDKIEALTSGIPLLNRKLRDLTIRMPVIAEPVAHRAGDELYRTVNHRIARHQDRRRADSHGEIRRDLR